MRLRVEWDYQGFRHRAGERGDLRLSSSGLFYHADVGIKPPLFADRSILAVDEALTAFSEVAPRQAKVVEMRYFGGLTEEEIVAALKISPRTARRDWHLAKAWLLRELSYKTGETTRA